MNIFEYARNRIKQKYSSRSDHSCEDVKRREDFELWGINCLEEHSKDSIKDAITCRLEAFWSVQTDEEKLFIGGGIAATAFVLIVFLYGIKDTPLNILILNVAESFFFYFEVLCAVFLYRLIRKRFIKRKFFYIAWILFFILSIPHIPVLFGYETTQIGDFYEAREYTAQYYVFMSKEPANVEKRTIYKLPAEIERRLDHLGTTDVYEDYYFQEHGGTDIYELNYHINHLYFPNGGYLSFDYDYAYEGPDRSLLIVGQEMKVTDSHDNEYYVKLTAEKVK